MSMYTHRFSVLKKIIKWLPGLAIEDKKDAVRQQIPRTRFDVCLLMNMILNRYV
jgi:hypothetical protein